VELKTVLAGRITGGDKRHRTKEEVRLDYYRKKKQDWRGGLQYVKKRRRKNV